MGSKSRLCRICLDAKLGDLVAFQTDSDWAHLFEFCTGLSVTKSNAPQYFCNSCSGKLRKFSDFKNQCFKSDVLWQQIIENANNEHRKDKSKLKIENLTNDDDHSHFDDGIECDDSLNDTKSYESKEEKPNQNVDLIDYSDFDDTIPSEDQVTNKSNKPQIKETKQPVARSKKSTRTIKPSAKFTFSNESPQVPSKDYYALTLTGIPVKIIRFPKMSENLPAAKNSDNLLFKKPKQALSKFTKKKNIVNGKKTNISAQNLESNSTVNEQATTYLNLEDLNSQIKKSLPRPQKSKPNANFTLENIKIVSFLNEVITENIQTKYFKELQEFEEASCREDDEKDNQDSDYDPEDDIAYQYSKPKGYHGGTKVKVVKYKAGTGIKRKGIELPNDTKFYCGICKFGPTDSEATKQHWSMHIVKGDINCRFCQFIGRDMADMAAHRYEHTPPEYKTIKTCLVCFEKTTVTRNLEFHYRSVHLNKKGGICKLCGHEFATIKHLRSHEKGHTHPWICDHCGKNFWSRHNMENHWITLMATKKHVCEYCGQKFKKKWCLDSHILSVHVDSKLKCHHCDETFRTKGILRGHLRSLSGPQHFCETCGKGYTTATGLIRHKRLHTSEKPYSCDQCQKYFRWKSNLNEHIIRLHTKVKSNKCEVCSRTFFLKKELKLHMSMHTGIRPVKCLYNECDKTFYNRNSLKAHCESKHRNVDSLIMPSLIR